MISICENPAVLNPAKHLPRSQREALKAIASFKRQNRAVSGSWFIGPLRFEGRTIQNLMAAQLVRESRAGLQLTIGGQLARDKLLGANHGSR